jgi:hypothetical protein
MSFDLQEALNGAPVKLRNGRKAFVMYDLRKYPSLLESTGFKPLNGIVLGDDENDGGRVEWGELGANERIQFDIVGMWEAPELTSEQVLEKAFNEGLFVAQSANCQIKLKVIAKAKDGVFVLEADNGFMSKSVDGEYVLYKDLTPKSDTITVTLPKPFKPKPGEKFWFIDKVGADLQVSHKIKSNHALTGDGNRPILAQIQRHRPQSDNDY